MLAARQLLWEYVGARAYSLLTRRAASQLPAIAFSFDIDGVLVRGGEVLAPARRALRRLYSQDGQEPRYPTCFLTNGGGVTEQAKADQLSGWLGVRVSAEQVILSHTPFQALATPGAYQARPVLAVGRGQVAEVAAAYGFRSVVTPAALAAAHPPSMLPFSSRAIRAAWAAEVGGDESGSCERAAALGTAAAPIAAVLVFNDPVDWYRDLQLVVDIVSSGGVVGRWPSDYAPRPPVYFSNPDLVFANDFPTPRLGQGAFAAAVQAVYAQVAGRPLECVTSFGKPNAEPFRLAAASLAAQARRLAGGAAAPASLGDNPASDVAGARAAGAPWVPVLVTATSVWPGLGNSAAAPADLVVDDVEAAVAVALKH